MRILRVIWSMDPKEGGPIQGIRNSIPELTKLGILNEVVSLDKPGSGFIGSDSFKITALGPKVGPWGYSNKLIPWLNDNFHRFDVVIVHGLWQFPSYATYKALYQYRKTNTKSPRLYIMPHGMLDPWFQKAKGRKLKAIRNWIFWKTVEKKVVNNADGLLFTCNAELELARQTFHPYRPKKEINVSYGIKSPPPFSLEMENSFKELCNEIKQPYFLFLSRINYKKGVDLLIEAYAEIIKAYANKNIVIPKLVIAGPGIDTDYGLFITNLVKQNQLDDDVIFPGMLSGNSKWGAFYGCEAFILPSHQENFGIAVVESMACGKSVLISNQVNIWREISEAGAGIIEDDTVRGVVSMISSWLELSEYDKLNMRERARRSFSDKFAIESAARQFLAGVSETNK